MSARLHTVCQRLPISLCHNDDNWQWTLHDTSNWPIGQDGQGIERWGDGSIFTGSFKDGRTDTLSGCPQWGHPEMALSAKPPHTRQTFGSVLVGDSRRQGCTPIYLPTTWPPSFLLSCFLEQPLTCQFCCPSSSQSARKHGHGKFMWGEGCMYEAALSEESVECLCSHCLWWIAICSTCWSRWSPRETSRTMTCMVKAPLAEAFQLKWLTCSS